MKKDVTIAILAILAVFAISYGISTVRPNLPPPKTTAAAPAGQTAAPGTPNDPVIMRINGEPVTEREFAYFVSSLPEQMQQFYSNPAGRRQMAEQYVRMKVMEQEAKRLGVDNDPDVSARMKFGYTNVAVEYALQKIASKTSDAQLRAEFEKNKNKFSAAELRHILIAYQGGRVPSTHGAALSIEQAMAKAQQIAAALRKGADFAAIARAQSDDTGSAGQGGYIGPVPHGSLPPEMQSAVDKLQPGQISDPVRSEFGIHIFRVDGRRPQSFDEVKQALKQQVQQNTVNDQVVQLQKSASVQYDPKFFPPVPKQPAQPPVPAPSQQKP